MKVSDFTLDARLGAGETCAPSTWVSDSALACRRVLFSTGVLPEVEELQVQTLARRHPLIRQSRLDFGLGCKE